jgi:hypothetical protein
MTIPDFVDYWSPKQAGWVQLRIAHLFDDDGVSDVLCGLYPAFLLSPQIFLAFPLVFPSRFSFSFFLLVFPSRFSFSFFLLAFPSHLCDNPRYACSPTNVGYEVIFESMKIESVPKKEEPQSQPQQDAEQPQPQPHAESEPQPQP